MNEDAVRNWITKAENDPKIGRDEIETENPATDGVCFHMQQCVEKYLKAFLIFNGREFRRTHDIAELIELCAEIEPEFNELKNIGAIELTDYAVEVRYGEEIYFPTINEAKDALDICLKVKDFVVKKLKSMGFQLQ